MSGRAVVSSPFIHLFFPSVWTLGFFVQQIIILYYYYLCDAQIVLGLVSQGLTQLVPVFF